MEEALKQRIMKRVHRIYYLRVALSPLMLKVYVLGILGGLASFAVSIPDVIRNAPMITDVDALYTFSTFSLLNTELSVQLMVAVGAATFLWIIRDIMHSLRGGDSPLSAF